MHVKKGPVLSKEKKKKNLFGDLRGSFFVNNSLCCIAFWCSRACKSIPIVFQVTQIKKNSFVSLLPKSHCDNVSWFVLDLKP